MGSKETNMDPKEIKNTTDKMLPQVDVNPKVVKNTAILIVGCTGAGKSTLGNWILDEDLFESKNKMGRVTKECQTTPIRIDGREFVMVDTPDIQDYRNFEGIVGMIKHFLGDGVINHMIVAFSHLNKTQTEEYHIEDRLNLSMKKFLETIENRWIISPNPDIFNRNDQVVKQSMNNIKEMILKFNKAYNLLNFRDARRQKSNTTLIFIIIGFISLFLGFLGFKNYEHLRYYI
ncbi:25933_t:CDS:2 [Dentiscutata erythropus]|uniref:25933_t:CDS:1 n=1 Tax=Dentiscutata erythropus TaxID=1348616 RepID=A0A9N9BKV9_9GLOM|nr:25933_t:CDS:2 [Dentiscutata erythropus]